MSKRKKKAKSKVTQRNQSPKSDSSSSSSSSSEDDRVVVVSKKSPSTTKASTMTFDSSCNDNDDDSSIIISPTMMKKQIKVKDSYLSDSSHSDTKVKQSAKKKHSEEQKTKIGGRRHSPRKLAKTTSKCIQGMANEEDESFHDSDSLKSSEVKVFKGKTKKELEEEDESYSEGDSENDMEEVYRDRYLSSGDDDDDDDSKSRESKQSNKADYMSFDDEADSDVDSKKKEKKRIRITPLKIRKSRRKRYVTEKVRDNIEDEKEKKRLDRDNTPRRIPPKCSSEYDEITMEPLPPVHVCYLAPDGKTRHCFCLDTIYRASIMTGNRQHRNDGSKKLQFLQPPHFRTAMDPDLIDEIASRFGRQALDIENTDVYQKENNLLQLRYDFHLDDQDTSQASFAATFSRYLKRQMGSGDVYCCPICYCEAQRRFNGGSESDDDDYDLDEGDDDDDSSQHYSVDKVASSKFDPMSILGALDHDVYEVASSFCFLRLSLVKKHLRDTHELDPRMVSGNDFYKRFMIRAQDGLLQRHLYFNRIAFSGAMQRYWFEGHNQNFILLRVLIERRQHMLDEGIDFDDCDFSSSFHIRASKMWSYLIAPYANSKSDDSDFIDDSEVEEVEDFGPRPVFEKPEDIEGEFVAHLRQKRESLKSKKRHGYESTDSDDNSNSDDDSEEDELIIVGKPDSDDEIEEIESSEDEWVVAKRQKALSKHLTPSSSKRIKKKDKSDSSDDDADDLVFVSSSVKKASAYQSLNSSSDEADVSPSTKRGKVLFESSDEE